MVHQCEKNHFPIRIASLECFGGSPIFGHAHKVSISVLVELAKLDELH
jgi:hypothetical protein